MTSNSRLETFIKDYQNLVPSLKHLAFPIYKTHLETLVKEHLNNIKYSIPVEFLEYIKVLDSKENEHLKKRHK